MAMAAAYHLPRPDNGPSTIAPNVHVNLYPRGLALNDLDFKDTRYPTLNSLSMANRRTSAMPIGPSDTFSRDSRNDGTRRVDSGPANRIAAEVKEVDETQSGARLHSGNGLVEGPGQQQQAQPYNLEPSASYASSPRADQTRRVVERYSPDENKVGLPMATTSGRPPLVEPPRKESVPASQQQGAGFSSRQRPNTSPSIPWQAPLLNAGIGAGLNSRDSTFPPIVPFSASPSYNGGAMGMPVPISPKPRAYAQQPTYVTPASAPNPINPVYLPPRQDEVCGECAMRDQDMAGVDVTSPGVWDRESDALYDDLVKREQEEDACEVFSTESHKSNRSSRSNRPRAKGGRLSESNLKLWLTMNPREPQARQQTLHLYLKTQRTLLDAEILAHARAMQESRQLDTQMRDTYSQLRRSAYDIGIHSAAADDSGGVRIMTPGGTAGPGAHGHSHSREVTLLENGLIVEHVNVRKEEREERERRRKEEKRERSRARKSSRGSAYSVHSIAAPATDGGLGLRPRYSGSSPVRPTSAVSTSDRPPSFPRAYSQASFSDVHSLGSVSPRQRFFGFKNLSAGWRSRDSLAPSGMSGSMVDMHVALQREGYDQRVYSPTDFERKTPSLRQSQVWPHSGELPQIRLEDIPKKKKHGLAKIWKTLTGSKKSSSQADSYNGHIGSFGEDDLPLAPPPPLSYLVERGPGEHTGPIARQSTISLPSIASPKNMLSSPTMSPVTSPSSLLPSPTSSRPNIDQESTADLKKLVWAHAELERAEPLAEEGSKPATPRNLQPILSEHGDNRRIAQESPSTSSLTVPKQSTTSRPQSMLSREKSLPPLPPDENFRPLVDPRPQTVYTYDPRQRPPGASPPVQDLAAPRAPFYAADSRRQSLGGLTSRPSAQTLPAKGAVYAQENMAPERYDEFGISRRSLGYLEHIEEKHPTPRPATPSKRKSKFGLATFLGRKSQVYDGDFLGSPELPGSRKSISDGRDDVLSNGGYTNSASRHSVGPRMSVMSRKAIEELVSQDPNFVAYRYPSSDQRLDLLR